MSPCGRAEKNDQQNDRTGTTLNTWCLKGTDKYSTQDYAAEKPMDQIEQQFEIYHSRRRTKQAQSDLPHHRQPLLQVIQIRHSQQNMTSWWLLSVLPATTLHGSTRLSIRKISPQSDRELEAKIQTDPSRIMSSAGFHITELEAVYERKICLWPGTTAKCRGDLLSLPQASYGTQNRIGYTESEEPFHHQYQNYYKQWYVPNNMAICMSRRFGPGWNHCLDR